MACSGVELCCQGQSHGKHALPCMSCSWGKQTRDNHSTQCLQTDRPEHSCVCLHVWSQYLQYSEVHEMIFMSVFICKRSWRNWDRQRQLWAELGTCRRARVWKMLHCLFANLPDVAYIHQTRVLQSHTLDCSSLTVHRIENHTRSCRKAFAPSPHCDLFHIEICMCTVYPQIKHDLLSVRTFIYANAGKNQRNASSNCHWIPANTSTPNAKTHHKIIPASY